MSSSVTQIRIDDELKAQASTICDELGMDLPTAIRMFLKRMVLVRGIPFNVTLPAVGSAASEEPVIEMTDDEKIDFVAARILREHRAAFEELAK